MKPIKSILVTGSTGQVEAVTYDRWTKNIEGIEFHFALHADPSPGQPFLRDLRVSEVSTGFDTGTVVLHPVHAVQLTESALKVLSSRQIKQIARASLHNKLNQVGHVKFMEAVVGAQIRIAKMGEPEPTPEPAATTTADNFKEGRDWQLHKSGEFNPRDTNGMEGLGKLIGVIN